MNVVKRVDGRLCRFSFCTKYFARAVSESLIIEDLSSGKVMTYQCLNPIEDLAWSPDSDFIYCGQYKSGVVQIFSLRAPLWRFNLQSERDNISSGRWSPDSRHILTTSQFMEYISIWSLVKRTVCYIQLLKPIAHPAIEFSPNGKFLALLEAENSDDFISIFGTSTWERLSKFKCSKFINSSGGLSWCPDSNKVCVWDSQLNCCRAFVYTVSEMDLVSSYFESEISRPAGIQSTSWSPSGQLLLLASYDNMIRVLNNITWTPISQLDCSKMIKDKDCFVYSQEVCKPSPIVSSNAVHIKASFKILEERPIVLASESKKFGFLLKWNHNGKYLAVVNHRFNYAIRIWDMKSLSLHSVIVLDFPISDFKWSPTTNQLAICYNKSVITVWTEDNVKSVSIPFLSKKGSLSLKSIDWQPRTGSYLALCSEAECVLMKAALS